ncbi:uncharacterized protein TrAFT101_002396 [Trichoderma asperellum]|uniref:uncharacterized protein n=1 Tax=Trichoderma asperellum TaxID=101201 RepID=UPI00331F1BFF|nr:hypothetical protein TrAFT101_002396 [Trichoderma asperellum]
MPSQIDSFEPGKIDASDGFKAGWYGPGGSAFRLLPFKFQLVGNIPCKSWGRDFAKGDFNTSAGENGPDFDCQKRSN